MQALLELDLPLELQPCALCGAIEFEPLARQDRHLLGLVTAGCTTCGLLQTNPRPSAASLNRFYERDYRRLYQGTLDPSDEYVARFRKGERLRYTADYLLRNLPLDDGSLLLDHGSGEGSLFVALRQRGYRGRLAGVEPNPNFAHYAAETGQADVRPTVDGFEAIDAVVLNHVLEHLPHPLAVLRDLWQRASAGGHLYIDVPDADRYSHVGDLHIAHITHFTQRTLEAAVVAAGFEVVTLEAHDPPHHPRSIRLIARADAGRPLTPVGCESATESATWQHMRAMDAQSWRWSVASRLARIGPLRSSYRAVRRCLSPAPGGSGH